MGSRKRLTKKEIKHDPIIENALLAWRYLSRHRNQAVTVAMAAVALVIIVWGATSYRRSRTAGAETNLGRALMQLQIGDREQAAATLQELSTEMGGSLAGKRAVFYLGQMKFEDGDFVAARALFDQFRRRGPDDPLMKASAAKGVADCDAGLGKMAEAAEEYMAAGTRFSDNPLAPDCFYLAGLAFSRSGDTTRAIEVLERLISQFPEFGRIGESRVLLGELQAQQRVLRKG